MLYQSITFLKRSIIITNDLYFSETNKRDCSALIKHTISDTLLVLQCASLFKGSRQFRKQPLRRYNSVALLLYAYTCSNCHSFISSCSLKCVICDYKENKMNIAHSSCKNCVTTNDLCLTPIEQPQAVSSSNILYRNYDFPGYDRSGLCSCCKNKTNFVSLSNIKSFSCSTVHQNKCDFTMDGNKSTIRTSRIDCGNSETREPDLNSHKATNYVWRPRTIEAGETWTCKRCTLLNNANSVFCEACESPFQPDLNSNISPSVLIKVIRIS